MKTWIPEFNEPYFFADFEQDTRVFAPNQEIYTEEDLDTFGFEIFKTQEECQVFCDKLNVAISKVKKEYQTHLHKGCQNEKKEGVINKYFKVVNSVAEDEVQQKMKKMFENFNNENGHYPVYADCVIQFLDDGSEVEESFKMSNDAEEGIDDDVFYFCSGLNDLQSLTEKGSCNDFIITDITQVY